MEAGLPTFAVLGNPDYGMATPKDEVELWVADTLESALEALGDAVLLRPTDAPRAPLRRVNGTRLRGTPRRRVPTALPPPRSAPWR